jgi:hypothetical protein
MNPREVGRNWSPISTQPGAACWERRPDQSKAQAWLATNPGFKLTDCITYAKNVIEWAYRQQGDVATANRVPRLGISLFEFLVNEKDWKGIYWNCDVSRPKDGQVHHVDAYIKVKKTGRYKIAGKYTLDVPITASVLQFKPTSSAVQPRHYRSRISSQGLTLPVVTTGLLRNLKRARFGVILGKAGDHNALLLSGVVYEVNYCVGPNSPYLYHRGPFEKWAETWGSGIVVVAPGEWASAASSAA